MPFDDSSRPVNSGVIHAWRLRHATVRSSLTGGMPQPRDGLTGDSTRPDWSMPLTVSLSVMQLSPGGSIPALCSFACVNNYVLANSNRSDRCYSNRHSYSYVALGIESEKKET